MDRGIGSVKHHTMKATVHNSAASVKSETMNGVTGASWPNQYLSLCGQAKVKYPVFLKPVKRSVLYCLPGPLCQKTCESITLILCPCCHGPSLFPVVDVLELNHQKLCFFYSSFVSTKNIQPQTINLNGGGFQIDLFHHEDDFKEKDCTEHVWDLNLRP